ncbi:MAG: hypothetical protein LBP52_03445 [Burkholderiaceae bacterium]|jgi:sterol desaturase/sphingolipid hydroxylase (fatty acid hydroxylase superfamily)|nr:hypothetical protein [Burkholderiaceae bacterium]
MNKPSEPKRGRQPAATEDWALPPLQALARLLQAQQEQGNSRKKTVRRVFGAILYFLCAVLLLAYLMPVNIFKLGMSSRHIAMALFFILVLALFATWRYWYQNDDLLLWEKLHDDAVDDGSHTLWDD